MWTLPLKGSIRLGWLVIKVNLHGPLEFAALLHHVVAHLGRNEADDHGTLRRSVVQTLDVADLLGLDREMLEDEGLYVAPQLLVVVGNR
jgi:hypothetical protein